jgi:ATP-dependent exoDNAse (exonuclease V) alpha subunit
MKRVQIKIATRICSKDLGGCGRTIESGEYAWQQLRTRGGNKKRTRTRRYLCETCYKKVAQ